MAGKCFEDITSAKMSTAAGPISFPGKGLGVILIKEKRMKGKRREWNLRCPNL